MQTLLLAALLLCVASDDHATIDGTWSSSEDWGFASGETIIIHRGRFKYWFSSCVRTPDDPIYPICGKVVHDGGVIRLVPDIGNKLDRATWMFTVYAGAICLIAAEDFWPPTSDVERPSRPPLDALLYKLSKQDLDATKRAATNAPPPRLSFPNEYE